MSLVCYNPYRFSPENRCTCYRVTKTQSPFQRNDIMADCISPSVSLISLNFSKERRGNLVCQCRAHNRLKVCTNRGIGFDSPDYPSGSLTPEPQYLTNDRINQIEEPDGCKTIEWQIRLSSSFRCRALMFKFGVLARRYVGPNILTFRRDVHSGETVKPQPERYLKKNDVNLQNRKF